MYKNNLLKLQTSKIYALQPCHFTLKYVFRTFPVPSFVWSVAMTAFESCFLTLCAFMSLLRAYATRSSVVRTSLCCVVILFTSFALHRPLHVLEHFASQPFTWNLDIFRGDTVTERHQICFGAFSFCFNPTHLSCPMILQSPVFRSSVVMSNS